MYGIFPGRELEALFFFWFHPLYLSIFVTLPAWPVTFFALALRSPHRNRLKWWIFMPIASFAGAVVGTVKAGLMLWIPAILFFGSELPPDEGLSFQTLTYVAIGAAATALFSAAWTFETDRKLHEGKR